MMITRLGICRNSKFLAANPGMRIVMVRYGIPQGCSVSATSSVDGDDSRKRLMTRSTAQDAGCLLHLITFWCSCSSFGIHKYTLKYCHSCILLLCLKPCPPSTSTSFIAVSATTSHSSQTTHSLFFKPIEFLTAVPPGRQKLLYKGRELTGTHPPETTIKNAGLTDGIKVHMVGSRDQQLDTMVKVEREKQRQEQVIQYKNAS